MEHPDADADLRVVRSGLDVPVAQPERLGTDPLDPHLRSCATPARRFVQRSGPDRFEQLGRKQDVGLGHLVHAIRRAARVALVVRRSAGAAAARQPRRSRR